MKTLIEQSKIKGGFNYETLFKVSKVAGSLGNWIIDWILTADIAIEINSIKE